MSLYHMSVVPDLFSFVYQQCGKGGGMVSCMQPNPAHVQINFVYLPAACVARFQQAADQHRSMAWQLGILAICLREPA